MYIINDVNLKINSMFIKMAENQKEINIPLGLLNTILNDKVAGHEFCCKKL